MGTASLLRETVYGVADVATLDAIETELRRDREVSRRDGSCAAWTTWALHWPSRSPCAVRWT
jgi:hypothetical protein